MILGPMPTPTRCRAARPSGTRAIRATGRPAPRFALGIASRFDRDITAPLTRAGESRSPNQVIVPGAFDHSLTAVRAGRRVVRLLLDHDPDLVLCDTSDGSLSLWADGESLNILIDGSTRRGRRAVVVLAALPSHRECSVGGEVSPRHIVTAGDTWLLSRIILHEVSIVRAGACPDTRLKLW